MSATFRALGRFAGKWLAPPFVAFLVFCLVLSVVAAPKSIDPEKALEEKEVDGSFVTGAGVRTHYIKEGKGDITIVLLHGFGGSTYSWRKSISDLSRDFTVFAIDIRGFGYTSRDQAAEYSPRGYATHISTFMDIVGIRRPVIVGHSLGGEVAIRIALQRPDDTAGIVLIDSAGVNRARGTLPPIPDPIRSAMLRVATSEGIVRTGLEAAFYDRTSIDKEMIRAYRDPLDVEGSTDALWKMLRTSAPMLTRSEIARVSVPTLILWGREDRLIPVSDGEELASLIDGSRLVVYERAGHMLLEERADDVNGAITEFAAVVGQPLPGQERPVPPPPGQGPAPIAGSSPTPRPGESPRTGPSPFPTGVLPTLR